MIEGRVTDAKKHVAVKARSKTSELRLMLVFEKDVSIYVQQAFEEMRGKGYTGNMEEYTYQFHVGSEKNERKEIPYRCWKVCEGEISVIGFYYRTKSLQKARHPEGLLKHIDAAKPANRIEEEAWRFLTGGLKFSNQKIGDIPPEKIRRDVLVLYCEYAGLTGELAKEALIKLKESIRLHIPQQIKAIELWNNQTGYKFVEDFYQMWRD